MSSSDGSEISFNDDSGSGSGLFGDTPFEKDWGDLEEEEQSAALLLGYEEGTWPRINREWPEWDDLEEAEREAAEALGLDEDLWPPKQDLFVREWVELEGEQQEAALKLGYTPELWPTISREWPDWDDLAEDEQEAAGTLGLDEYSWPPEDPDSDWSAEDLYSSAEIEEEEGADKQQVIAMYNKVVAVENKNDGPDEWGFKAYSRIVCLQCRLGNFEEMTTAYRTMIGDDYRRVTTRLKTEEISRVLSVAGSAGGGADDVLLQVFETTLTMFESQTRIWVQTQLKLAEVFKRKADWSRVQECCAAIHSRTQKTADSEAELKKLLPTEGKWSALIKKQARGGFVVDDPMYATELTHTFALEIVQKRKFTGSKTKLSDLYTRAKACNEASTANPEHSGVIHECGGDLSMAVRDYDEAYTLFLAAFSDFEASGHDDKIVCIKKCVVSKMLSKDEIDPFTNPSMSGYRSHESVSQWYDMLLSYQAKPAPDVEKFTTALSKENLGSDPVLAPYHADLRQNAHILKLKELIGAYTTIRLSYVAQELHLSDEDEAERLCAMLILDGNLGGWIDQVEGVLHVEEGSSSAAADARKFNGLSDWAGKLGAIRKNVGAKVLAMTD